MKFHNVINMQNLLSFTPGPEIVQIEEPTEDEKRAEERKRVMDDLFGLAEDFGQASMVKNQGVKRLTDEEIEEIENRKHEANQYLTSRFRDYLCGNNGNNNL